MSILYDLIYFILLFLYLPYLLLRRKWHNGILSRLGFIDKDLSARLEEKPNIWIHAVSVGEVMAVKGLVSALQKNYPSCNMVFSTVTQTGNRLAKEQFKEAVVIYAPLDFRWAVRRYLRRICPKMYISAETEIWPNLYSELHASRVPIVQVNGRISDRAFRGYKRIRIMIKRALDCVTVFCVQSQIDADRIFHLGASFKKIRVVGNLKFDMDFKKKSATKADLFFGEDDLVLVAGSTHPHEEQMLIDVYRRLLKKFSRLRLIIAPRHIERKEEVGQILTKNGLPWVAFSSGLNRKKDKDAVVLIDTIGHLCMLYSMADIVFVGKSFSVGGGQNMIEPLFFGKPTFVGPKTENFKSVVDILKREKVLFVVQDPDHLCRRIAEVLNDPLALAKIGRKAKEVIEKYRGATEKTLLEIEKILRDRDIK